MPRYTDPETGKSISSEVPLTDSEITQAFNISKTPEIQPKETSVTPSFLSTMVSNIPKSGVEFLKSIITPITHPIETAKGLGGTALGFVEKLVPGEQEHEVYANAMIDFMKDRYGGLENIKKTIKDDPVGFMADVSTIFTGIGGAGRLATTSTGRLGRIASTISKIGKATEPISAVSKTVGLPFSFLQKKVVAPTLGLTTGVGGETVRRSMEASRAFRKGLRGKISPEEIVLKERSALNTLKNQRSQEYTTQLSQISGLQNIIDITPVKQELGRYMSSSRFNIRRTQQGKLDFSRSTIDRTGIKDATEIIRKIETWGSQPGDLTPKGLDILKRQLDDFYTENKNTRAMVSGLRDKVKQSLVNQVPEYQTMTRGYEKTTRLIKEIEKDLALGTKNSIDAGITRLRTTLRDDAEFRRSLVQTLENIGGTELLDEIAGLQMKTFIPSAGTHAGLAGRIAAGGLFTTLFGITPESLAIIASTSPRTIAELNNVIAQAIRLEKRIPKEIIPGLFQAGRTKQLTSQ